MQIVKHFYSEQIASLYLNRLKAEGIPCFLSNTATSTLMPFGEGGISLHVEDKDVETAMEIILEMDENALQKVDEDFKEADLADIIYEKEVQEYEQSLKANPSKFINLLFIILLIIIILMLSYKNFTF